MFSHMIGNNDIRVSYLPNQLTPRNKKQRKYCQIIRNLIQVLDLINYYVNSVINSAMSKYFSYYHYLGHFSLHNHRKVKSNHLSSSDLINTSEPYIEPSDFKSLEFKRFD